jgi:uncharacterized protein YsxB (DUF464 family)
MIKVVFYKCGNEYYGFRETGHAEFDDEGKGIVCSAVSAMSMLVINTIEVSYGVDIDVDIDEKTADLKVIVKEALKKYSKDETKRYAISGLLEGYFIQLNDMLEEYYDYMDVDEEEKDI